MAWQIDDAHSAIQFKVRHMMISSVRGVFESFHGTVDLDEANPENTTVDITVDVSSLNTRDKQRDTHLRSNDFFNAETEPDMRFKSTKVERTGDATAKLTGDLTIRGVTHPVTLDVEYQGKAKSPWGTTSVGFTADGKLNRKDWNLNWNQALETGGWLVGDTVEIHAEVELVQQAEAQQTATA